MKPPNTGCRVMKRKHMRHKSPLIETVARKGLVDITRYQKTSGSLDQSLDGVFTRSGTASSSGFGFSK